MRVVVAGGSGLIGSNLSRLLKKAGHTVTVLTRNPQVVSDLDYVKWNPEEPVEVSRCIEGAEAIVNLVGTNIGAKPWKQSRKELIRSSRVQAGKALARAAIETADPPRVFVQASAVGYYGTLCGPETLTERMPPGSDFLASVCVDWEASTNSLPLNGVRHITARFGIVLSGKGGALPRMLLPFRFGVGSPLGDGKQPFPWVHIHDVSRAVQFALETEEAAGIYNITSPSIGNNAEFSRTLADVLRRPLMPAIPSFIVRRMFGEMADLLLYGQNATSHRLQTLGFEFSFPQAELALTDLLS